MKLRGTDNQVISYFLSFLCALCEKCGSFYREMQRTDRESINHVGGDCLRGDPRRAAVRTAGAAPHAAVAPLPIAAVCPPHAVLC
eukprot:SAG31_NODE_5063_length_2763_cov_8.216967_2_plen_85_part_00